MPRFLFEASYTVEGLKGLRRQGGSGRREAVARAAQSVGGRLEHFYFAFGEHDAFAVADLPDNESAAAFALAVSEAGGASVRTVVLLTPEEVDEAAKHSVEYRPPMEWEARHFRGVRPLDERTPWALCPWLGNVLCGCVRSGGGP